MSAIEVKLGQAENEVSQLRSSLRQYEGLVDEYRSQVLQNADVQLNCRNRFGPTRPGFCALWTRKNTRN